ncbi:fumarate reductase [Desulfovibrio inopinatus]|uniref:fumarate reductase n=1 Tax=Desulfovibrio inopinatus TaxID=102109 RepID=UPI0004215FE5|nr:fumarate reductase [Desulfovibrio inopinatus]
MSLEAAIHVTRPSKRDAYLDWTQMLSGAVLILFMWSHMILVSSVVIGPGAMNALAYFFEATYMAQAGGPIIFLIFLLHFLLAARKIPFRSDGVKIAVGHARMLNHRDTWLWLVQVITALVILVLGAIHMWVVLTDLPITAAKSAARMQKAPWFLFYLILLPMVEMHVSVGFYRIGVKWGFITSGNRDKAKKFEYTLFGIFMFIGIITLIRFVTLG